MPSFAVALPPPQQRRLRAGWAQVGLVVALLIALWFLFAFGRTMAELSAATARTSAVRADNAALTERLAAAQNEAALLQSDAYLRFASRAFGMGGPGETAFGLQPGAPSPQPMIPLGETAPTTQQPAPLDNWLELLFGD